MDKDSQMRRVLFTINNPDAHNITEEEITKRLTTGITGIIYFCLSKEIGGKGHIPHYHIYAVFKNPKRFSTLKNLFPEAHIDRVNGSNSQTRDYVFKTGAWAGTEKETTRIEGTQKEYGTLPPDTGRYGSEFTAIMEQIRDGLSDLEIIEANPDLIPRLTDIQRCRQLIQQEQQKDNFRSLEVTYIWGEPETGKTRSVMEKYGYAGVFRVTDYAHPFDTYAGQDVILFDEFHSRFPLTDMNNYLDGYPLKLPARYSDKVAQYTKVYIISNLPLEQQYTSTQREEPEIWRAFLRRIQTVRHFTGIGKFKDQSTKKYMKAVYDFQKLHPGSVTPFTSPQGKTGAQPSRKVK